MRLLCLLAGLQTIAAVAQAQGPADPMVLRGPAAMAGFHGHISYLLDPGGKMGLSGAMAAAQAGGFRPLMLDSPDFGYTKARIWLRIPLRNDAPGIDQWRLLLEENFLQVFEVYLIAPDGTAKTLTIQRPDSPFSARPLAYPQLAVPFVLPPGQAGTLMLRYWSGGSSQIDLGLTDAADFTATAARRDAINFVFYGMMLSLILVGLLAFAVSREPVFLAYAGYAGSAAMFVMHSDGNAFRFLWPDAPLFNGQASILLGGGIVFFGALFSILFLRTRQFHPVLHRLLAGLAGLTLAMVAATPFVDTQILKKVMILLAFASSVLFVGAGLVAARTRFKQVRFYVIAWTGVLLSSGLMTARHWLGVEVSQEIQVATMRAVLVLDSILMGLAIWDSFNQMRLSRQAAMSANLVHTRRNLQLSQRLQDLEHHYALARQLADSQGRQFADTIHDLSQPLHALRLNIRALAGGAGDDAALSPRIEETFAYLERLVSDHLERSALGAAGAGNDGEAAAEAADPVGTGDVLRSIHEMFLPDAAAKGLDFRFVPTGAEAAVDALVLMRIVTNLVANAVKYTDTGRVLLGVRHRGGRIAVEVHDSGPGLTPEAFAAATATHARLDRDRARGEGHGLGLAIAVQLAAEHGLTLAADPRRTTGAGIVLTLPRA